MTRITAQQVKELRDRTGLGMMECKKALVEAQGTIEVAIENLRKSSGLKAAKKAGRVASDGLIIGKCEAGFGLLLEINSETDFVARDSNFIDFSHIVLEEAFSKRNSDVGQLMNGLIESERQKLVQKVGENISVRRISKLESELVGLYIHSNNRIGVLVGMESGSFDLAKDIAMHVAAMNPLVINPDDLSEEQLAKERDIFLGQAQSSQKPPEIIEKMVAGKIRKYLEEVSLVQQPFVKDSEKKIGDLLKTNGAKILDFVRFELGEGIQKNTVDFATEVHAQAGL